MPRTGNGKNSWAFENDRDGPGEDGRHFSVSGDRMSCEHVDADGNECPFKDRPKHSQNARNHLRSQHNITCTPQRPRKDESVAEQLSRRTRNSLTELSEDEMACMLFAQNGWAFNGVTGVGGMLMKRLGWKVPERHRLSEGLPPLKDRMLQAFFRQASYVTLAMDIGTVGDRYLCIMGVNPELDPVVLRLASVTLTSDNTFRKEEVVEILNEVKDLCKEHHCNVIGVVADNASNMQGPADTSMTRCFAHVVNLIFKDLAQPLPRGHRTLSDATHAYEEILEKFPNCVGRLLDQRWCYIVIRLGEILKFLDPARVGDDPELMLLRHTVEAGYLAFRPLKQAIDACQADSADMFTAFGAWQSMLAASRQDKQLKDAIINRLGYWVRDGQILLAYFSPLIQPAEYPPELDEIVEEILREHGEEYVREFQLAKTSMRLTLATATRAQWNDYVQNRFRARFPCITQLLMSTMRQNPSEASCERGLSILKRKRNPYRFSLSAVTTEAMMIASSIYEALIKGCVRGEEAAPAASRTRSEASPSARRPNDSQNTSQTDGTQTPPRQEIVLEQDGGVVSDSESDETDQALSPAVFQIILRAAIDKHRAATSAAAPAPPRTDDIVLPGRRNTRQTQAARDDMCAMCLNQQPAVQKGCKDHEPNRAYVQCYACAARFSVNHDVVRAAAPRHIREPEDTWAFGYRKLDVTIQCSEFGCVCRIPASVRPRGG